MVSKIKESSCDGKHIIHDKAKNYFHQHWSSGNLELAFN